MVLRKSNKNKTNSEVLWRSLNMGSYHTSRFLNSIEIYKFAHIGFHILFVFKIVKGCHCCLVMPYEPVSQHSSCGSPQSDWSLQGSPSVPFTSE